MTAVSRDPQALTDRHYKRHPALSLAYFFFAFLAPDFLAELPDDFFALPPVSDFDLAFADFDAEDFLAPLPFLAGSD